MARRTPLQLALANSLIFFGWYDRFYIDASSVSPENLFHLKKKAFLRQLALTDDAKDNSRLLNATVTLLESKESKNFLNFKYKIKTDRLFPERLNRKAEGRHIVSQVLSLVHIPNSAAAAAASATATAAATTTTAAGAT